MRAPLQVQQIVPELLAAIDRAVAAAAEASGGTWQGADNAEVAFSGSTAYLKQTPAPAADGRSIGTDASARGSRNGGAKGLLSGEVSFVIIGTGEQHCTIGSLTNPK